MNYCQNPKFQLGKTVITLGAIDVLTKNGLTSQLFLRKHQSGDWGDLCQEDKDLNDAAIACEGDINSQQRVLSSYKTGDDTIWVITEWDRSCTTILLPENY